ncbi:pre-mRNA-splicing factor SYF1 [Fagus crenata]
MEFVLYPSQDDLLYEEEILRNPFSLKLWWRYLIARTEAPFQKRFTIYERALKAIPGSYKLWRAYLLDRLDFVTHYPITHSHYQTLNNTFERALVTMHKMPRIWLMYLQTLTHQKLITKTRQAFDRALRSLPVTQHGRVWELYLLFVNQKGVPIETSLRIHRRYLTFDPTHVEDFIDFLVSSSLWQEASERLASVLNDDKFCSIKGKTKHSLWLELCELLTRHANEVSGLNVDAIIRCGIKKFTDDVGRLWTSLAEYYIRRNLHEKARDIFEEGMMTVLTVRDFSLLFDSYMQFEEIILAHKMETTLSLDDGEEEEDVGLDSVANFEKKILHGFWLYHGDDDKDVDVDVRLARLDSLIKRRPELANSVLLRQNPHNVELWHQRVKLFEGDPNKQILTYTEAMRTIDPIKAVGKPHTLWVNFANLYVNHNDIQNARIIFNVAVQFKYKAIDHLASVWCEWAEMELRQKNFKGALELLRRATAQPSVDLKQRVHIKPYRSLKLWSFHLDLEESLGTLESTRAVYERIWDIGICTPQIILNSASLLEEHKFFEDAFKVYERGVKIFKYPHVKDIWVTYLSKFIKRYGMTKLERARELFERAVETAPANAVKPLYLQYAKLEEDYGLAKRAMKVYEQAIKAVPNNEKLSLYDIYIARVAEIFGVPKTRELYEQAIESGLPDKDMRTMCLRYAELEKSLGEIDRARGIYVFASQFAADPRSDGDVWNKWHEFEVQHGNEDSFREMLHIKRSVSGRQLAPVVDNAAAKDSSRKVGFVSAGSDGGIEVAVNHEDIELSEESDSDNDEKVKIAQKKDVPSAVFGGLIRKRDEADNDAGGQIATATKEMDGDSRLGALERMKRLKKA